MALSGAALGHSLFHAETHQRAVETPYKYNKLVLRPSGKLKISLEEQRTLMRHEDVRTTLRYGGESKAETGRAANARVVETLSGRA